MFAKQASRVAEEGNAVVLYAGKERVTSLRLRRGDVYNCRFGAFPHDHMIGRRFGSKISAVGKKKAGHCYMLRPTPELWASGPLVHRTQIIYPLDVAQICFNLELRPGSVVVESGTGSGSLSIGIARCVFPTGRLHTFEFHKGRQAEAEAFFRDIQLDGVITSRHRDVCADGFGLEPESVDALVLDLPAPYLCVEHAHKVLKKNANFCSFSPCIEQVQRTCDELRRLGFEEINTIESLTRPMQVATKSYSAMQFKKFAREAMLPSRSPAWKESQEQEARERAGMEVDSAAEEVLPQKRVRTDGEGDGEAVGGAVASKWAGTPLPELPSHCRTELSARFAVEVKGHTSYLTFARKIVRSAPATP
eukprot:CAMPEP_0114624754 /NCGR_PEP_ID=MMETSP0168-20121206/10925_1 /TAXON_ID=95228 ORGANISM="Vannella sp., Strain DIVA3 517/6/12" /NCGR_SAMPLE_ID=MMETSP0168 /ASSEMBLY_ACC=CAM_ASM_000044 /LENGTH=362 /DNA_ID=CAMNT_0001836029 /DNA_START=43 /DNA_END=1127 /DNA_ORIENTATION=-